MSNRSSRLCTPNRSFSPSPPIRLITLVLASWSVVCKPLPAAAETSGDDVGEVEAIDVLLLPFAWMLQAALLPRSNIFAISGTILSQFGLTTDSPLCRVAELEYGGSRMTLLILFGSRLR